MNEKAVVVMSQLSLSGRSSYAFMVGTFRKKTACVRFAKPLKLRSKPDEGRWEKDCYI